MIPGPTPVPERVLQALSKHPIGHRSKEFQKLVESTSKNLQWLHQTQNDVLTITGSGTAAMEAGIINTLSRGDKVCLLYTSPSPRDISGSRMPSSA